MTCEDVIFSEISERDIREFLCRWLFAALL